MMVSSPPSPAPESELLPLTKASSMFASKPCIATLWRWMQDGINAPDGSRVRLRYTMIGRRRFIERAAVAEFLAACNAVPVASSSAVPKGAANAALVAMGY